MPRILIGVNGRTNQATGLDGTGPRHLREQTWRGDHVAVKQLIEDFARYLYLPRLREPEVLLGAVKDGIALLTWEQDSFALADSPLFLRCTTLM